MRRALLWLALALSLGAVAGWQAADRHLWKAFAALALAYVAVAYTLESWPERGRGR